MALWQWILVFGASGLALVWAGTILAVTGDQIAESTRMGGLLVGMLLMAAATSLPEIATVVGAAANEAQDLAVGSLFGSSMANMAILAIIDLAHRQRRVWAQVELEQSRVASIAIAMTAIALLGITTPEGPEVGWVGIDTVLVLGFYLAALAWIRRSPHSRHTQSLRLSPSGDAEDQGAGIGLRRSVAKFAGGALVILVAGPVAARAGEGIVATSGLSETFVGVTFLALATSLPELLASLAAVRIGAYDLAVGNVFGSNSFNMVVLVFADIAYRPGPILSAVDSSQITVGVAAIVMMSLALAAIVHGQETRFRRFEPDAILLLVVYVLSLVLIVGV